MKGGDSESGYKKGLWTEEEDRILMEYINIHGMGKWNRIAQITGLKRCGKSCRLRWMNYLSPNIKRGDFSEEEEDLIIRLHNLLGNRWSLIAGRVPGRTDNQVKNHWNTHLSKKLGFKKGKRPKICNYASRRVMKENSNMTLVEHGCHRALNRRIAENQLQDAVESEVGAQEPTTSDIFIQTDSVWFINNDEMNLYTPEWVDYVGGHGHGLDFIWDGL